MCPTLVCLLNRARTSPGFGVFDVRHPVVITFAGWTCSQRVLPRTGSDALSPWSGASSATVEGGVGAGLQSPEVDGLQQAAQVRTSYFL